MSRWEQDLEEAQRRLAGLDAERELASALEAAASVRYVTSFAGFFLPLPPVARPYISLYGDFWDEQDEERHADRVHFDARGPPVAHLTPGRPKHLWWWDGDGSFLEIELMGSGPHVRRFRREHLVTASRGGCCSSPTSAPATATG